MGISCTRASRGGKRLRWAVLGTVVAGALWACNDRRLVAPTPAPESAERNRFAQSLNRKLDLLFMIDNSGSMEQLQDKLAKNLPILVHGLTALPGGLPDIHIAVVSSSVQPGATTTISGCGQNNFDDGHFRHTFNPTGIPNHPECAGIALDGTFIKAEAGAAPNFTGRIEDVFGCIALLGQTGCGFEQQLGAIVRALDPGAPLPDNAGFIRDDAYLGVVMLTNEDDCTTPRDTHLFDDALSTSAGPLGRLMSYRCAEFGITCGGERPPHTLAPGQTTVESDCVPAEDQGQLFRTADFEAFLLGLKHGNRSKILLASISGKPAPFAVSTTQSRSSPASKTDPSAPGLVPSCVSANGNDYADPGVRIAKVVKDFGGVVFDICENDYSPAMDQIARALGQLLKPECLGGNVANDGEGHPDCTVASRTYATDGSRRETTIPYCGTEVAPFPSPCWRLFASPADCATGRLFRLCHDATCSTTTTGTTDSSSDVTVECAVGP